MSHGAINIKHCTVPLMPWSPFPCKFDPSVYNATPGQPTDLCTKELTNNGFLGTMPNLDRACFPDGIKGGRKLLGAKIGLKFKVAMGRQYDRSYRMFISDAVVSSQYCVRLDQHVSMTTALYSCNLHLSSCQVAFGTTTEPTYYPPSSGGGEKKWATERDITHLQAIFKPGSAILFQLFSLLTNDYYVPIWASAELELLYGRSPEIPPESQIPNEVLPLWTQTLISGTGGG